MVGGALGIAFVIAKLGVALTATTGIVTGIKYFITYEWEPKKKPGSRKPLGGKNDDDNEFESMRSNFRGRN